MDARRGLRRVATLAAHVTPQSSGVVVAPEVAEALAAGKAVVALESTIVSHGMPYPQNLTMAREAGAYTSQLNLSRDCRKKAPYTPQTLPSTP
jgi:hypothetical protein